MGARVGDGIETMDGGTEDLARSSSSSSSSSTYGSSTRSSFISGRICAWSISCDKIARIGYGNGEDGGERNEGGPSQLHPPPSVGGDDGHAMILILRGGHSK